MNFRHIFLAFFFVASFGLTACGGDDPVSGNTCAVDNDCALGTVCSASKTCVSAACDFCTVSQVCYKPTPTSEGSCSKPECTGDDDCTDGTCEKGLCEAGGGGGCTKNADCADGERCDITDTCVPDEAQTCSGDMDCGANEKCVDDKCVGGCADNSDCAGTEFCAADSTCKTGCQDNTGCTIAGQVCTEGICGCDATSCGEGKACLATGLCGNPTSCDQVTCPDTDVCNPVDFACIPKCTAESCNANEACNVATGQCEVTNCPGEDTTQCEGATDGRTIWDPIKCFCAECLGDDECNTAAGETCTAGGKCFACETACQDSLGCGGATPYCISDCCVQCVSANDCAGGELCIEGSCNPPPNCSADPTVCPAGTSCDANGQCTTVGGGSACDPNDPTSCPAPGVCDAVSMTCTNPFGGGDCGFCGVDANGDCSCPNGDCAPDPLFGIIPICSCTPIIGSDAECPAGQSCSLVGACL